MAIKRRSAIKKRATAASMQTEDQVMSFRIEGSLYERLRKASFDLRKPMRDFISRGIEKVLEEDGY